MNKIYLHWAATNYEWCQPDHYHYIITGDGQVHQLHDHQEILPHTSCRNTNAIAICISCMGGEGFSDYPPTEKQIESMCRKTADLCKQFGWVSPDGRVLTHAEAAALRDYPKDAVSKSTAANYAAYGLPHDNYGPMSWHDGWPGGTAERWDLWQLKPSDKGGIGGFLLRDKIKEYMKSSVQVEVKSDVKKIQERIKIKALLKKACEEYKLDYNIMMAQWIIESNLAPDVISTSRALGVCQIKLATAQKVAKRNKIRVPTSEKDLLGIENAEYNIRLGCCHMAELIKKSSQNPIFAAWIMYHAGPSSFDLGKVLPASCEYVNKIAIKLQAIQKMK